MSIHFHSLKVKNIVRETSDCVSVSFEVPEELQSEFSFREGQNITIRKKINDEEIRRSYSICNAPHEKELKVAVKKIENGLFSSFANDTLKCGDLLEVMPPTGRFNAHLSENDNGNYLAIAAGSGITPIISIIKHTLSTEKNSRFTLLYGNKNRGSIIFFDELEGLKNKYIERFNFINILSKEKTDAPVFHGRISAEKLTELRKIIDYNNLNAAYLCGPETMIFSAKDFLESNGVNQSNIHFELFKTMGAAKTQIKTSMKSDNPSGKKSNITIKLDGRSFAFDLATNGESILDAALKQGADLPFACKGGVCCTCKAKVIEGNVKMDVNYALEPEEITQGYVLTCQSHPITDNVIIDFDVK